MGDPAAQNWFFSGLGSVRVFFCLQVLSGGAFGRCLELLLGTLRYFFVNDFEKVLVFVRCAKSVSFVTDMDGSIKSSDTHIC